MSASILAGKQARGEGHFQHYQCLVKSRSITTNKRFAGHDSLDTTMIYIQATRSDLQKEVEKIAWV